MSNLKSPAAIAVVIALLVCAGVYSALQTQRERPESLQRWAARWHDGRFAVERPELAPPGRVRLVVFSDYQCPFCGDVVPLVEDVVSGYSAENAAVEMVERDYPLDSKCNALIGRSVHPLACDSAVAVRLIRKVKGIDEARRTSNWLYQNRPTISSELIRTKLESLGLVAEFRDQYDALVSEIRADVTLATELGVSGTPTLFINGRLANVRDRRSLAALIDHELSVLREHGASPARSADNLSNGTANEIAVQARARP